MSESREKICFRGRLSPAQRRERRQIEEAAARLDLEKRRIQEAFFRLLQAAVSEYPEGEEGWTLFQERWVSTKWEEEAFPLVRALADVVREDENARLALSWLVTFAMEAINGNKCL